MDLNFILSPDQIPEDSIIIATDPDIDRLTTLRGDLEGHLKCCYSHNKTSGIFRLHLIYKQYVKFSGDDYEKEEISEEKEGR